MSIFSQVPPTKISRSVHRMNPRNTMSFDFAKLYPILTELISPGESIKGHLEQFIRSMPMIAPVMDMIDIKVDAYFVPIRLIWDDFEDMITLGPTGEFTAEAPLVGVNTTFASSSDLAPFLSFFSEGGLPDYLNFPTLYKPEVGAVYKRYLDALPFRAYQTIYNEYYRNENLEDEIPVSHASGAMDLHLEAYSRQPEDIIDNFILQTRGWKKDYFTSALPKPQKGPAVRMPGADTIISDGPLRLKQGSSLVDDQDQIRTVEVATDVAPDPVTGEGGVQSYALDAYHATMPTEGAEYKEGLALADFPTIEELRYTEVLQEFYEASARGGSRSKEYYLNIWHTRTKDARLDRPEYLGGYRGPVSITDVDQTSQSDISAQATPAGKGLSAGGNKLFKYHTTEWGILMVIMSCQPKPSYYQGTRRWNLYKTVFDWPNPFFANLGEQEIKNQEIYDDPTDGENDGTFGYAPRYSEAKFIPNTVHGQFRSSLDYWHLSRKFGSRPHLNKNFVHVQPEEAARIFPLQVSNNDKLVGTFYFRITRKMFLPYYGVPRLIHSI